MTTSSNLDDGAGHGTASTPGDSGRTSPSLSHPLQDLIARVEAATGADRELDDAVCLACGYSRGPGPGPAYRHGPYWYEPDGKLYGEVSPQVTASIDATLGLVERVLDTAFIDIEVAKRFVGGEAHGRAEICGPDVDAYATAATPPLALLLALLRALQAQPQATWKLTPEQSDQFADALINPPTPNSALRDAAKRHRS